MQPKCQHLSSLRDVADASRLQGMLHRRTLIRTATVLYFSQSSHQECLGSAGSSAYSVDYVDRRPTDHISQSKLKPKFLKGCKATLLCRVTLGRLTAGRVGLRRPPFGADAVQQMNKPNLLPFAKDDIFAVFDNSQAYPEYVIHFKL